MWRCVAMILSLALVFLASCGEATQQTQNQGGLSLALATEPAPPLAGRATTLRFELQSANTAIDDAKISFTRGMPGMQHPDEQTPVLAQPIGNGHYQAQTEFVMGGRWLVAVSIQVASGQPVVMTFPIDVEQP